jgi:serine/threonine protein kinase
MANLVGRTVGKYRIVARLGRGGMAEVYKAYQPGLDRYVGIKVLHGHLVDDEDFIGRFQREALAIGKLRHPNIVQAVDFDHHGESYFMAMEFINGPTLKDELKARHEANKPFTFEEIALIFSALCSAIDYAHARGMVHRDIKPANVMINEEGQVVLTDFGIARIMGATQYTQTGALSGTPAYMSPEQGQGERGDERSDIYSLGVMLYEMATGSVPYDADTPFAVIMKHISEPLPMPSAVNPNIPKAVEQVILKAMAKNPNDRYQTAGEMSTALREASDVSPGKNLQNTPLTIVAPPPKIEQIEHATGPLTLEERTMGAAGSDGGATVLSPSTGATTIRVAEKKQNLMPIFIGMGAVLVILIVGGIIASVIVASNRNATATETAQAIAVAATATADQQATAQAAAESESEAAAANAAAETATAQFLAPTQTAAAVIAAGEQAAATETAQAERDAALVGGLLATVQAATAEAKATADTATAEFIASFTATPTPTETPLPTDTPTPAPVVVVPTNTPTPAAPTATPTPERPSLPGGKLAFPVDDGGGKYDVFVVSMPDGKVINQIKGARQPNFRSDGQKLLVNGQGGSFGENVFLADAAGNIERAVSGSPSDLFPFMKDDGTTLAFSNPQLAFGSQGYQSYLFVQCSLNPPNTEADDRCKAVADFQIIVPSGNLGDVIGSHPVWTFPGDRLAYKGCNTWAGGGRCGMYSVGSWATKHLGGETPVLLVDGSSVTPTDARKGLIAFMSRESGDWEVFVMPEGGGGAVNVSNSPGAEDGLGTISPDGAWVAFASNRGGAWAVYAAPTGGGAAAKLFDFPKANPWGVGDREWTNERMSWGK